jgi:chorismate mutase
MRSLAVLLLAAPAAATKDAVTPLEKITEMMNGMLSKGKEEKHKEEVEFAKFKVWCDNTQDETHASIKQAADDIVQLTASIDKNEADAEQLTAEVADLEALVATNEEELAAATKIRNKENADYKAEHADLSESIDAIERASSVLKSKMGTQAQAASLIQIKAQLPETARAVVDSFIALDSNSGAPEAAGYEAQSGGIIDMLEKMRLKFEDQRLGLEKAEIAAKSNFETLKMALSDEIKSSEKSIAQKTAKKAQCLDDAAQAKGDLEITKAAKAEDETKLSDCLAECAARADEFEKNQVLRKDEIVAISTALKILSSDAVSGNADKHLPQFVQTSFAQLRSSTSEDGTRQRVVEFLQSRAKKIDSRYLALVANHATEDPFAKIKSMIKELIVKLMEEANAEADHKGYCDSELATNKQTRENKASEAEDLTAQIEKATADIAQLTEEITTLADDIAAIKGQQADAQGIRDAEKAKNQETISDAKVAQAAVEKAMQVLKDFYAKAEASSLIQGTNGLEQEMAQASKAPYKGMASGGGNLVDFLDVILSDFARLESETSTAEDNSQASHDKFMNEANDDVALKSTEQEHKEGKRDQLTELNRNLKKELKLTQEELDAALKYYDELKPDCLDMGLSYADRKAQREEEIQSLKEALKMFE